MVKTRKINVVDLNEIKSVDNNAATHTETVETAEESAESPVVSEPVLEVETPTVKDETTDVKPMKKCDEKATCAFCNKVMSVKALRYSHDKNCKGKQPVPQTKPEPPTPRPSKPDAPVNQPRTKPTRAETRQQRLNNLVSQAL